MVRASSRPEAEAAAQLTTTKNPQKSNPQKSRTPPKGLKKYSGAPRRSAESSSNPKPLDPHTKSPGTVPATLHVAPL